MNEKYVKKILQNKFVWLLFAVIVIAIGMRCLLGQLIQVQGESMEPTFKSGAFVWVENRTEPKRNDIVVVTKKNAGKSTRYIKRIIGLPGEKIQIKKGAVYINGNVLTEKIECEPIEDGGMARNAILLGDDEYFLLGDNRNKSKDSRNVELGIVQKKQILGRVSFRLFPFERY